MGESRDANDPRDLLRAMNKRAREEFEEAERSDTGGQEHASRLERGPARDRDEGAIAAGAKRSTRAQPETEKLDRPRGGDVASGGGQRTAGATSDEE